MSKIGKISITIPDKVKVLINGPLVNIEGPIGKKSLNIDNNIEGPLGKQKLRINLEMFDFKIDDGKNVSIKPKKLDDDTKRLWGMNRSLLSNAILGASKGYEKNLELSGVGYRAAIKGKQLNLQLGFSHDINFDIPEGIKIAVEKQTILKISGPDKQLVGMVVSKIKSFRPPEPYKGKGVLFEGQKLKRKAGKSGKI